MLTPDTTATAVASGMVRHRPESSRTSRVPVRTSISPTTMNNAALKTACASTMDTAAKVAFPEPMESSVTIRPSCDTVPQARISFAST